MAWDATIIHTSTPSHLHASVSVRASRPQLSRTRFLNIRTFPTAMTSGRWPSKPSGPSGHWRSILYTRWRRCYVRGPATVGCARAPTAAQAGNARRIVERLTPATARREFVRTNPPARSLLHCQIAATVQIGSGAFISEAFSMALGRWFVIFPLNYSFISNVTVILSFKLQM